MQHYGVVLLSGGINSTVGLALMQREGIACTALSFVYGQRHQRAEIASARRIADYYHTPHEIVRLRFPHIVENTPEPKESLRSGLARADLVGRMMLFLTYAACYADMLNLDRICCGVDAGTVAERRDCQPAALSAWTQMIRAVFVDGAELCLPFVQMAQAEIVHLGNHLAAPLHLTWSCHDPQPGRTSCGVCPGCLKRAASYGNP